MNIPIKMNKDFEKIMSKMSEKYGEDFERLNGFHRKISLIEEETEREIWLEKADEISNMIDAILISFDYSKYSHTYVLLKARINMFRIDDRIEIGRLIEYKEKLQHVANETREGNETLYKAAEEMVAEYEKAIQWRLDV